MLSWGLHDEFPAAQRSPPIVLLQLRFEHEEFSGVGAQWGTYSRTCPSKVRLFSEAFMSPHGIGTQSRF
jgi:hypothetical protein